MNPLVSRRSFLKSTALVSVGLAGSFRLRGASPNEKLNVAVVGIHNQGRYNLDNVSSQNVVALCDVDSKFLDAVKPKYPGAKTYDDFRKMLEQKEIEAVVVATPDHTHAVIATQALNSGRHVYCEKPLTRTLSECRAVQEAAAKNKRVTQMGNQIHAGSNYRRVVELIQSNTVGKVKEVHVWTTSAWGNKTWPKDFPPAPAHLNYDLWLGPIEPVPYHPEFLPFTWRNWWPFGNGSLGDFGCHFMDLPHWALELKAPVSAVAEGPEFNPHCPPHWMKVNYEYPARGEKPPVKLTWYHGGKQPEMLSKELLSKWNSGVLFIGEKGMVLADYGRRMLLPEDDFKDFKAPEPTIPESIGHHKEWYEACKTEGKTTCNFDYSGPLTEAVLVGNLAYLVGKKVEWDSAGLKARNNSDADKFIQHHYRQGWSLKG